MTFTRQEEDDNGRVMVTADEKRVLQGLNRNEPTQVRTLSGSENFECERWKLSTVDAFI